MKRILCLIESLGPGGAERQLSGLAVMLKQQGYEVEVCYYINNEFYLPYLEANSVHSVFFAEAAKPRKRFFALRKHVKAYNPDTVISYSVSPSVIMCLLKFLGKKLNLIVSERSNTQKITRIVKLRFFLYRWADYVVPNSFSQGSFIKKQFPKLVNKIKVITNYVDTDVFSPLFKREEHDETRMLCVGRLWPEKNIPRLIKAIKIVVSDGFNLKVDWFGQDLKDASSSECYRVLQQEHMERNFVFHAPVSIIHEEYQKADVFCLPSLYEGFPNVLCEAMSCGKAVLCSRVYDNPNIVQEGKNGFLFDPLSVDDMAATIERYLQLTDEKKTEMGIMSREIAVKLFSRDSFIQKYVALL